MGHGNKSKNKTQAKHSKAKRQVGIQPKTEFKGQHPKTHEIIHGKKCIPIVITQQQRSEKIEPRQLAYKLFRKYLKEHDHYALQNNRGYYPPYKMLNLQEDETMAYFNAMHRNLTYEETAHNCGGYHYMPYPEECKNIDVNDIRNTSLKRRCLNFIHKNLALTYQISSERAFVTYHYQPQMIVKLRLPNCLIEQLLHLYDNCKFHRQLSGIIYESQSVNMRYVREGTVLMEKMKQAFPLETHKLHAPGLLYKLTEICLKTSKAQENPELHGKYSEVDHYIEGPDMGSPIRELIKKLTIGPAKIYQIKDGRVQVLGAILS